jgi:putative hydrolase of the HAD superfamily
MNKSIKAILFNSNRVLCYPVTGHWYIPPNFFQIINRRAYDRRRDIEIAAAFGQASEIFQKYSHIASLDEEYSLFLEYYQLFFACLRVLKISSLQIEQVAHDMVYNPDKYAFFADALEIIPALSTNYKLVVVTDGRPSLEDVYIKAGLRPYFSAFTGSSIVGSARPDAQMVETVLKELGAAPDEALYVDDSIENCDIARRLGFQTVLLCRDSTLYFFRKLTNRAHKVIRSLADLPGLQDEK